MLGLYFYYGALDYLKLKVSMISIILVLGIYLFSLSVIEKKKHRSLLFANSKRKDLSTNTLRVSSFKVKKGRLKEIEKNLIYKSGIKRHLKFMSFEILVFFSFLLFIIMAYLMIAIFGLRLYSLIPAIIGFFIPFVCLDMLRKYNSEKSRRLLVKFISSMYRWSSVKEDVVFCFEKTLEMGVGNPIDPYICDLLIQVNGGLSINQALDIFGERVDNEFFKTFIINIKHSVKCRGKLEKLLANLEREAYKIEEEFDRRKISMFKDKMIVYTAMLSVIIVFYLQLKTNPRVARFYLESSMGGSLLTLFSLLFIVGVLMSLDLNKVEY